jgi:hypothetical protein
MVENDPYAPSTIKGSIPPELPHRRAKKIGCMLDDRRIGIEGVGAVMSMDCRQGGRIFARGDGAGNFEFQGVVRQRKEAGAEPGGPFAGISDMDPRSSVSVESAEAEVCRRFPWANRWDQNDYDNVARICAP